MPVVVVPMRDPSGRGVTPIRLNHLISHTRYVRNCHDHDDELLSIISLRAVI
jgi:hypothetical protein